ncbi:uncharacterized protein RSE6_11547 [Rhynchosporium secalis]|uniref:Uncharacterized protein n=1 Tax=Rhynchosporium secalis TaxID=38038 RepID=A0A1E1MN71_RHYSE|nr:uncharacterized protein RSE6_11547 [Rhynchosporium secalis]
MFDVSWTDPARETVGQRNNRKEQEAVKGNGARKKTSGLARAPSIRSSNSSGSVFGQKTSSLLKIFSSSSSRKDVTSRAGYHTQTPASTIEELPKNTQRLSICTSGSDSSGHAIPGKTTRIPKNGFFGRSPPYYSEGELSAHSEASESVFSGWTSTSAKTESTWDSSEESFTGPGTVVQPVSESSFITQDTKVTVSSRGSNNIAEQTATIVHISASGTMPILVEDSSGKSSGPFSTFEFPLPGATFPKTPPRETTSKVEFPLPGAVFLTSPEENTKNEISIRRNAHPITKRPPHCYTWKPPETWECSTYSPKALSPQRRTSTSLRPIKEKHHKVPLSEIAHLQRSIRLMEAASSKIVLERLKEKWAEVADASIYRELEIEKQMWMLSALRKLKNGGTASCSSLSALTTAVAVHHLSTNPLCPKSYPNIHPLQVPGPTSQLPYASGIFTSIHAFPIPSLLAASSIPSVLKECHRTLRSAVKAPGLTSTLALQVPTTSRGGTLHLTILDPSPLLATLGPRLRSWLDNHLILHLEKQFMCLNPSRLFPIWLSDARLRGEGSTIVNVRFFASVTSTTLDVSSNVREEVNGAGREDTESTKQELKSIVGRMLWKEIWGAYVQGDKWWWEDARILEECERMGTMWEYAVIEAVKDG